MKIHHLLFTALLIIALGTLTTSCWTDLEQYEEFVCERFGGDADNDGVCSRNDCNDYNPNLYAGAPCDDGDSLTINDFINADCDCIGE